MASVPPPAPIVLLTKADTAGAHLATVKPLLGSEAWSEQLMDTIAATARNSMGINRNRLICSLQPGDGFP
jgi:hypothetical protein